MSQNTNLVKHYAFKSVGKGPVPNKWDNNKFSKSVNMRFNNGIFHCDCNI